MVEFNHQILFQGFRCQGGQYRRSVGLNPDSGYVDIALKVLKEIKLFPFYFQFRSNKSVGGIMGRPLLDTLRRRRPTVTTRPEFKNDRGRGFNQFGDLVFESFKDGSSFDRTTYRDIFVAPNGIEEITANIANIRAHKEGDVRVPVTDIRQYYPTHSPFAQRINVVLRSGNNDPDSVDDKGELFTLITVLQNLFSQLPGSPSIIGGDLLDPAFKPRAPRNLVGTGQPVVQFIQRLLDQYGLIAGFTPEGDYTINQQVSKRGSDGKVARDVGKFEKMDFLTYETRSPSFTLRPSVAIVIGKKIMRRVTVQYEAAIEDVDGQLRRLVDIPKLWGYSLAKINAGVYAGTEKQFDDVPPVDTALGFARRQALREHAYKTYAPSIFFTVGPRIPVAGATGTAIASAGGIATYADKDFEVLNYMPMQEAPIYRFQQRNLVRQLPIDTGVRDLDEVVLVAPIVTASYLTSGVFRDFAAVKKRFSGLEQSDGIAKANLDATLAKWRRRLRNILKDIQKMQTAVGKQKMWDSSLIQEFREGARGAFGLEPGGFEQERNRLLNRIRRLEIETILIRDHIKSSKAKIAELSGKILTWVKEFARLKKFYEKHGALWLRYNVPPQVIQSGFSLERDSGVLHFNNPVTQGTKPFYLEGDPEDVKTDGFVDVTWGYEADYNWLPDFTNFWFAAEDKDDAPRVDLISVNDVGAIPPFIIPAPDMRMYLEEDGTPMNVGPMRALAEDMATPILTQPRTAVGFNQEYAGLRKVVLDGGVHQVTHTFDGDVAATHVAINAPGARHPLGPPNLKGVPDTIQTEILAIQLQGQEVVET